MALRIAVPNFPLEHDVPPVAEPGAAVANERRVKLEAYLELDPAIRFVIALALVAAISLLYLVQTSTVTQLNYEVQRGAVERTKLVRAQQELQLEIARAQALPQIEQVARTRLQMVPVGDQYRYLEVPAESDAAPGTLP
jgi:cell division protein FtsL